MKDIRQINFEDLIELYFRHTLAREAEEYLSLSRRGKAEIPLPHLLRYHEQEGVTDRREIHLRDCFDSLLAFYSLLEIAIVISFVPDPAEDDFWMGVKANLSLEPVCKYYEENYPLLLPKLLRRRLHGEIEPKDKDNSQTAAIFTAFLGLEDRISKDRDIDIFMRLIDFFYFGQVRLNTLIAVLMDKRDFMQRILKPPEERDVLDRGLQGFIKFLLFSNELDEILQESSEYPVFQSAMWHYHGYWFQTIGDRVGEQLKVAVGHFLKWTPHVSEKEDRNEIEETVEQVTGVINRLTSRKYGDALRML